MISLAPGQVSIVIPLYNDVDNLDHCLSALTNARAKSPVDILVMDDGSTDTSLETIQRYDVKYNRSEEQRGQSWQRNRGAELTQSDYIVFIDSDVVVGGAFFQQVAEFISTDKPKGLIGLQGIHSLEHPFTEWSSLIFNTLLHLLNRKPQYSLGLNTSCFLVAREEFMTIGGFREDLRHLEDNEFASRMAAQGKYLLRGPVQFVHRAQIGWGCIIHKLIHGGRTKNHLRRLKLSQANEAVALPSRAGRNLLYFKWLWAGIIIIIALIVSAIFHHRYISAGSILVATLFCIPLMTDVLVLLRVKANPIFFLVGTLFYMISPWIIILGNLLGRVCDNFEIAEKC